ncbi:general secretion pathway protein GspM [Sphingomonas sp. Leaf412]|uniref:type II secretion system protein GspM n=1 Tax=Sphingomonas sp. Leaf412 TaxID=1736370 RepID=UPI0006F560F7|nr:type II secretion system protein GspM [Sphingomonas sp. Leaf412]KQT32732.1 general secretion pathway protein GspM [Sphingomonas sp. Leaf412]
MTPLREWFAGRSLRERRLLLVMVALAIVTLVWGAIIMPVRGGLSSSRARYTDAVVRLGEAQAGLVQVKAIQRRAGSPAAGALPDVVRAGAEAAGLTPSTLDPQDGDRVRVGIASARAGALTAWIAGLEASGVLAESVAIAGNGDGTVNARLTLARRGG